MANRESVLTEEFYFEDPDKTTIRKVSVPRQRAFISESKERKVRGSSQGGLVYGKKFSGIY